VNTATFIGGKYKGNRGGVIATLGLVFPSLVIISIIAAFLKNFAEFPLVQHAFAGIRACVCVLILNSVLKLRKSTVIDGPTTVIFLVALVLALISNFANLSGVLGWLISPAVLVILAGLCGLGLGLKGGRVK
jgi:chromate transporter